jgi:phosphoribosyl-ATP pyrophosphohydrolase
MKLEEYQLAVRAVQHYQSLGYNYVEVPWIVSEYANKATLPDDGNIGRFVGTDKCFIGSAEQGIIELFAGYPYNKDTANTLMNKLLVSVSPCVRLSDNSTIYHKETFLKVELSYVTDDSKSAKDVLGIITKDALNFHKMLFGSRISYEGGDITVSTSNDGDVELGSYGVRSIKGLYYVYGTGLALPRATMVHTPGYHTVPIIKGTLGKLSKILEEVDELVDAESQDNKLLVVNELSDLVGAINHYAETKGVTLDDLIKMNSVTERAFKSGRRK